MMVLEGPDKGRVYECNTDGATNILVGREDVRSEAHWQLSSKDYFVSRNHFLLEIRPPNCRISDPYSKNGTFLKRGELEKRVEEELLENGDQIRIGKTFLAMELVANNYNKKQEISIPRHETGPLKTGSETNTVPATSNCIRCGANMEYTLPSSGSVLSGSDFMCAECRKQEEQFKSKEAEKQVSQSYYCMNEHCGQDVSDQANTDGRAAEFSDVALYYCPECSKREEAEAFLNYNFYQGDIGGYRLIRWLGKGGFGEVYKGWHPETCRLAAIKVMNPLKTKEAGLVYRFHREISIMQDFNHSNLVRFYEEGQVNQRPFLVLEYVPDGDFSQLLSDEGRSLYTAHDIIKFFEDALTGLDYFHRRDSQPGRNYVHRDIKPENILIRRDKDQVVSKLADFGLAKCYEEHGGTITRSKQFAGTFIYMAPEQITNFKYSKPPVDIYAMGVTIYYLLSGRYPLDFTPMWQVKKGKPMLQRGRPVDMVLAGKRLPLLEARPDLPKSLCEAVDKSLSINPDQRYQSAEAFRLALLDAI